MYVYINVLTGIVKVLMRNWLLAFSSSHNHNVMDLTLAISGSIEGSRYWTSALVIFHTFFPLILVKSTLKLEVKLYGFQW